VALRIRERAAFFKICLEKESPEAHLMPEIAPLIDPSVAVRRAREEGSAIVALESTVIAHGLPRPENLLTARRLESAVVEAGATPATIGIVDGRPLIGLEQEQLDAFANRDGIVKVNPGNLAQVVAEGGWGATTVAATMHLAHRAGIGVFATGGIGGVHRGAGESFDLSADLTALARYPLIVVCAGAKAILDLPKTVEALETLGVPVVGYETGEFPAFYSRSSGLKLDLRADDPREVVALARAHHRLGLNTAILVVTPVPVEHELALEEVSSAIDEALAETARLGLHGKMVTPFLLARIAERTDGRALRANLSLLENNARLAGRLARAMISNQ
jgi:pseudouridine-5'-phosphate glycosidase